MNDIIEIKGSAPANNLPSDKIILTLSIIGAALSLVGIFGVLSLFIYSLVIGYLLFFALFQAPVAGIVVSAIGLRKSKKYEKLGGPESRKATVGKALSTASLNANVFLVIVYCMAMFMKILFVFRVFNLSDSVISAIS